VPLSASPAAGSPPSGVSRLTVLALMGFAFVGVVGTVVLLSSAGVTWDQPSAFAAVGALAAVITMAASVVAIAVADRSNVAELGLIGNGLLSMSVVGAAHAAVTPAALYEDNAAFGVAGLLVVPSFVLSSLPVLLATTNFGRWAARRWRDWSILSTFVAFVVAFALTGLPDVWPNVSARGLVSVAVCGASFIAVIAPARRFRRRFAISGSNGSLIVPIAFVGLALTAFAPMTNAFGIGFWGVRALGFVAALTLAGCIVVTAKRATHVHAAFEPVLEIDPFLSLDLAASPLVNGYVATEADGLAGTADMALRVAERMKLSVDQRRNLGLAAVMHDVGKTRIPQEILRKPGSLSAEEFRLVQEHAANGADMLAGDRLLAPCAHIVRAHHERVDGAGYPDGLAGSSIPIEARIIAACDAFDAITHDRDYRRGLPVGLSLAILNSNAGQQWDAEVVRHLMMVVADSDLAAPATECELVVPDDLADLLAQVDCEI
jgi:hypothetical protein